MATQTKLWKQRNTMSEMAACGRLPGSASGETARQRAADRAWITQCVADRRRERLQVGSLHIFRASLHGFSAQAAV